MANGTKVRFLPSRPLMKLSKEICKRCVEESLMPEADRDRMLGWTEDDERNWRCGWVACPELMWPSDDDTCGHVNQGPPSHCPFAAEHVVSQCQDA